MIETTRGGDTNETKSNDDDFKPGSRGSWNKYGYRVEVRDTSFSTLHPIVLPDGILGPEWREISFIKSENPAGVPFEDAYCAEHRLLTVEGAIALAYTILAQNPCKLGIECRIRRYHLEITFKVDKFGFADVPVIKHRMFAEADAIREAKRQQAAWETQKAVWDKEEAEPKQADLMKKEAMS